MASQERHGLWPWFAMPRTFCLWWWKSAPLPVAPAAAANIHRTEGEFIDIWKVKHVYSILTLYIYYLYLWLSFLFFYKYVYDFSTSLCTQTGCAGRSTEMLRNLVVDLEVTPLEVSKVKPIWPMSPAACSCHLVMCKSWGFSLRKHTVACPNTTKKRPINFELMRNLSCSGRTDQVVWGETKTTVVLGMLPKTCWVVHQDLVLNIHPSFHSL